MGGFILKVPLVAEFEQLQQSALKLKRELQKDLKEPPKIDLVKLRKEDSQAYDLDKERDILHEKIQMQLALAIESTSTAAFEAESQDPTAASSSRTKNTDNATHQQQSSKIKYFLQAIQLLAQLIELGEEEKGR